MIKHEWINTGLILLVAVISLVGIGANNQSQDPSYGTVANTYFRMPNSNAQFKTVTSAGDVAGTTGTLSGILTLNKAVGCVNFYATSTATRTNMSFIASSTAYSIGYMIANYGACS